MICRLSVLSLLVTATLAIGQQPPAEKDPQQVKQPAKPAAGSLEDTLEKSLRIAPTSRRLRPRFVRRRPSSIKFASKC